MRKPSLVLVALGLAAGASPELPESYRVQQPAGRD
jgi:hypothetical protein